MKFRIWLILLLGCQACQKAPLPSVSALPAAENAPAPMGSSTPNLEFLARTNMLQGIFTHNQLPQDSVESKRLEAVCELLQLKPEQLLNLKDVEQRYILGSYYFSERRFIEASETLSKLLDLSGQHSAARNLLARCFYLLGNADRAILELEYILKENLNDTQALLDALFLIGAIGLESEDVSAEQKEKSKRAFETYLKLAPDSPLSEKIKERLASEIASKSAPKSSDSLEKNPVIKSAVSAFEQGDLLVAQARLEKAKQQFPKNLKVRLLLARVYVQRSMIRDAFSEFEALLSLNPNYVEAWHYRGMAFMMAQDPEQAVACWQKVEQLNPDYAKRHQLAAKRAIAQGMINKGAAQ